MTKFISWAKGFNTNIELLRFKLTKKQATGKCNGTSNKTGRV